MQGGKVQYELPSTLKKTSYSFGKEKRGKRTSVGNEELDNTPAPGTYSPTNGSRGTGWSFSKSPPTCLNTTVPQLTEVPGPGSYEVTKADFGYKGAKYTLRPKTATPGNAPSKVEYVKNTPGPGAYQPKDAMDSIGTYFLSKYSNTKASTFSPVKLSRFDGNEPHHSPGPGAYDPKPALSCTGDYFVSVYKSSQSRKFGKAQSRPGSVLRQSSPGPAAYTLPNEFGVYGLPYCQRRKSSVGRGSPGGRERKSPDSAVTS